MKYEMIIRALSILYDSVSCDNELFFNKYQVGLDQIEATQYSFFFLIFNMNHLFKSENRILKDVSKATFLGVALHLEISYVMLRGVSSFT